MSNSPPEIRIPRFWAKALGITLMDAGHYATEQVVCPKIVEYLARCFPALEVRMSRTHREVYGWV